MRNMSQDIPNFQDLSSVPAENEDLQVQNVYQPAKVWFYPG